MDKMKSIEQSAKIAIATVLSHLAIRQFDFKTDDELLVIDALRRSDTELTNASYEDLSDYILRYDNIDSMRGLASNVKGIYHEIRVVDSENSDGDGITAKVFPDTNHPGADVVLTKDGVAIDEIQLKATNNSSLIERHFDRYPDTPVYATSEVAEKMENVRDSGFKNADLESDVHSTFENLLNDNPISHAEDVMAVSGIVSATKESIAVLRGQKSIEDASGQTLQDMGVAVSTSLLVDLLFS